MHMKNRQESCINTNFLIRKSSKMGEKYMGESLPEAALVQAAVNNGNAYAELESQLITIMPATISMPPKISTG